MVDMTADLGVSVDSSGVRAAVVDLKKLEDVARTVEGSMERHAVAAGQVGTTYTKHVAPSVRRTGIATQQLTNYFKNNSFAARSLVWQLNQIAQTGAVTGQWMQSVAIQLPDILGGFGLLGIAAGAVAGALGPLAIGLLSTSDAGKEMEEQVEVLNEHLDNLKRQQDIVSASTADLTERFGLQGDVIQSLVGDLSAYTEGLAVRSLQAQAQTLSEGSIFAGLPRTEDLERGRPSQFPGQMLGSLFGSTFEQTQAVKRMKELGFESVEQAARIRDAMDSLGESEGPAELINRIRTITDELKSTFGDVEDMPAELAAEYEQLIDLAERAGEVSGASGDIQAFEASLAIQDQVDRIREQIAATQESEEAVHRLQEAWKLDELVAETTRELEEAGVETENAARLAERLRGVMKALADEEAHQEQLRTARDLLDELSEQADMQRLISIYGRDSEQVAEARAEAEAQATRELINSLDVSESLKGELRAALSAAQAIAGTNIAAAIAAGANAAAVLRSNLQGAAAAFSDAMRAQRDAQIDAQTRLKYASDPVGLAGEQAVIDHRRRVRDDMFDNVSDMQAHAREEAIRREAEAAKELEINAQDAEKAYRDLMNPKKSGGGGGGGASKELELHNERLQEAERLYEDTRTAAEEFAIQLAEIRELSQTINPETGEAYIDAELTQRALRDLREEYLGIAAAARQMEDATTQMFVSIFSGAESASEALGNLLRQFGDMALNAAFAPLMEGMFGGVAQIFATPQRRAAGGPASANQPYIVGEKQAELFVPRTDGTIFPSVPSGGGSSVNVAPTFHIDARGADTAAVERLERALAGVVSTFKERTIDSLREARMEGKLQ